MEIVYGTYNPAKFSSMKSCVSDLDITIVKLSDINSNLVEADETGSTPLENAREKALNYYRQIRRPVFSCDSGLYFEGVLSSEQPGVKARRVNGKRLNDDEMIEHYSGLAKKYGGKLVAYYKNAISLVMDENNIIEYEEDDICSDKFYIVDTPHSERTKGFPLNSLSIEIESLKYYNDITVRKNNKVGEGFYNFFKRLINNMI
jgi:8-oxo-dGTP diphosphatase